MNGGVGQFARVLTATEKSMKTIPQVRPKPRPSHELVTDIHDELYRAVYAGDIVAAQAKLDELAMVGGDSLGTRIRSAKGAAA
jgi:hypothetical protein